jgi:tetratricopeptide (TPR) repeat protein
MRTKLSTFCDKIIEAGWLAAAVAVPLFFNIYSARTFEPDKITLMRSIVSVMILAWIISVVERGVGDPDSDTPISLADRFRQWLKIPLFLPTALLALIYIISTIFSLSPKVSLWGSYQRLQGTYSFLSYLVIFALMAGNLRTREQADRLVTTLIITSVPVGLYGIIQRHGLDPLPWAGDVIQRVASTMGNAIFVASYLIMIVPLTLSRLVESLTAIIKEEKASWGHTILAAVYIFILAVQIITVLFSGSRGPLLGLLAASFVMGLLVMLILRRLNADAASLSIREIGLGIAFVGPLGLAGGLGGGLGYFAGLGLQYLLPVEGLPLLGAALGGLLTFLGLYTFMAAAEKGWRWLWLSWFSIAILAIIFVVTLNIRGTPLDPYLDPIRKIPYVSRLANVIETRGTGKVRVLIWDAATKLVLPHQPLGIPGDDITGEDKFNYIRSLIGYGPESMFNAFAFVYPPGLAHVEARGSSADRSHNETMDSLVITGILGFLAFYFLMISLFYYALRWLGWAPDQSSRRRLVILLILGGIIGATIPLFVDKVDDPYTFVALGLPFGLLAGVVIHLVWQGLIRQTKDEDNVVAYPLLLIGLLGSIIGHFIEVHFVFSIAATYTYFWVFAGLIVAFSRMRESARQPASESTEQEAALDLNGEATANLKVKPEEPAFLDRRSKTRRPKKRRARRRGDKNKWSEASSSPRTREAYAQPAKGEGWEIWLGGQGLAMAIILIILTFDFITPQFQFKSGDKNSMSLLWMYSITWLVGLAIALSDLAIRQSKWGGRVSWLKAIILYFITSIVYFFFYYQAHRIQFKQQIIVNAATDVIKAANVLTNGLVIFYTFLFLLMALLAVLLSWQQGRRLPLWRSDIFNGILYPTLVITMALVIWFKNIDVVRADIYLKEGERYRGQSQWDQAIALHKKALSIDSDEDFYYLMLALDYQLMAQDGNLDPAQRQFAWQEGERIALEARNINPYNPDNTGNMGRYYFTLGQVFNQERFSEALAFFEKATMLAPSNVIYHNLWAQTHYILQNYEAAVAKLQESIEIDPKYAPTWLLLGDTYAAMGEVDQALEHHSRAITLWEREDGFGLFADQFLDQRLSFYSSAGRCDDIIAPIEQEALRRADRLAKAQSDEARKSAQNSYARVLCVMGHAYNLCGQQEKGVTYLEQCHSLGSGSYLKELANIYLAQNSYDQALPLYQLVVQNSPNDAEAHSALAFIYAQQGRLHEAIQENQVVLQQIPNDYDSLKNMAVIHQQLGQWQEALTFAQQALDIAPEAEQPAWQQFISEVESQLASSGD